MTKRAKSLTKGKSKASRAKTSRVKASRVRVTKRVRAKKTRISGNPVRRDQLDAFVDAAAHALALPLDPAWRPAVKTNLDVTLRLAAAFADFPLPDDAEPAPVFVA